jgi:hypothetical protein
MASPGLEHVGSTNEVLGAEVPLGSAGKLGKLAVEWNDPETVFAAVGLGAMQPEEVGLSSADQEYNLAA